MPTRPPFPEPADLLPILAERGFWVILVTPPAGVMEVDDEIAVIGGHSIVEGNLADRSPIFDRLPHEKPQVQSLACIGDGDVEAECTLRLGISPIEDMGEDFVPSIVLFAYGLADGSFQSHACLGDGDVEAECTLRLGISPI